MWLECRQFWRVLNHFLLEISNEIRKVNKSRRIMFHHNNANITPYLSGQKINLISHPPYSHDLVPKVTVDAFRKPCFGDDLSLV